MTTPGSSVRRVAAIDCGTNSIRLLIADVDPLNRTLTDVVREMRIVRLGQGVGATKTLAPQSIERTLKVAGEYAALCKEHGVPADAIRFVATSASRDAKNSADFTGPIQELFGVTPEVLTGDAEARLSFQGALSGLGRTRGPFLVVDLGGGSTEFVLGTSTVLAAKSVDIGCVRVSEKFLASDPPTQVERQMATEFIDEALSIAASAVPFQRAMALIGLAGSVCTVAAHTMRLKSYDSAAVHGSLLPVSDVLHACNELVTMTRSQRSVLPYLHEGRIDVIGAGALVWSRIITKVSEAAGLLKVLASEHDILDGVALDIGCRS